MGNWAQVNVDKIGDIEAIKVSITSFYLSTGINVTAIDSDGNKIYSCEKRSEFCDLFHECTQNTPACHHEYFRRGKISERFGEEKIFACSAGLIHFAAPIVSGKDFYGALVGGPILLEPPDNLTYERLMIENKIPAYAISQLLAYLNSIPVVRHEKAECLSKLLFMVCCSLQSKDSFVLGEHLGKADHQLIHIAYAGNLKNSIIKLALNYICENYYRNITLDSLANYVHLNRSYLSRLFKKELGIGFCEYLNKIKIEKSKALLKAGRYSIFEIALMVGFEDQSYYTKVFKKLTGDTPKEFRDKIAIG